MTTGRLVTWGCLVLALALSGQCASHQIPIVATRGAENPVPAQSNPTDTSMAASTQASTLGWLHTDGRGIKDSTGNDVRLRGINTYIRIQNEQAKFVSAKTMGANVVRLMLWKNDIEYPSSTYDPAWDRTGLAAIDRAVGWAHDAGLGVILVEQIWDTDIPSAPGTFLSDPALQTQWLAMWRTLVDRYKNDPTVIGIDLMNEPFLMKGIPPEITNREATWENVAKATINDLKTHNPNLLFIVEDFPMLKWQDTSFLRQPNIILSRHLYRTNQNWALKYDTGDTAAGKTLLASWIDATWMPYVDQGIPVWIGEIGFQSSNVNWQTQMTDEIDLFEARGLGYAIYTYGATRWRDPFDIVNPTTPYNLTMIGGVYRELLKTYSMR